MASEPPPMDYAEDQPAEKEIQETEEPQEPEEEKQKEDDDPPRVEPEPASPVAVSAPPPTLEAHAEDEGDDVPVSKPVMAQPQRTLDLFEDDEPPAPQQQVSSQVESSLYALRTPVCGVHRIVTWRIMHWRSRCLAQRRWGTGWEHTSPIPSPLQQLSLPSNLPRR